MLIYFAEVPLEEGFGVLRKRKQDRLVNGRRVSVCSGWSLFSELQKQSIRCWRCGCEADRWVVGKAPNDRRSPLVLNLYATRNGEVVLMTRDHIIPRSLGGTDAVGNLRPACEICNRQRGNEMSAEDLQFRAEHPALVNQHRLCQGTTRAQRALQQLNISPERATRIAAPFLQLDPTFDRGPKPDQN